MNKRWPDWGAATFAFGAALFPILRYIEIAAGRATVHVDVQDAWGLVAENVLDGTDLYVQASTADNKPPGIIFVSILGKLLGDLPLLLLSIVALSNTIIVWCSYRFARRLDAPAGASVVGAAVTMLMLSQFGNNGQTKTVILALAFCAVFVRSPWLAGIAVGVGMTIIQYAAFFLPPIAWLWYRRDGSKPSAQFLASALGSFSGSFVLVLVVWGPASFFGAAYYTFGITWKYISQEQMAIAFETGQRALLSEPWIWLESMYLYASQATIAIVPAIVGSIWLLSRTRERDDEFFEMCLLGLVGASALPFLIRPYSHYWALFTGAIGPLVGVGIGVVVDGQLGKQ